MIFHFPACDSLLVHPDEPELYEHKQVTNHFEGTGNLLSIRKDGPELDRKLVRVDLRCGAKDCIDESQGVFRLVAFFGFSTDLG